jgi:hypothetical protein
MWPLKMQTGYSRHFRPNGLDRGGDRGACIFGRIGDESRQKGGYAKAAMSGCDPAKRGKRRVIVKQNPTSSVNLQINKSGKNNVSLKINDPPVVLELGIWDDGSELPVFKP